MRVLSVVAAWLGNTEATAEPVGAEWSAPRAQGELIDVRRRTGVREWLAGPDFRISSETRSFDVQGLKVRSTGVRRRLRSGSGALSVHESRPGGSNPTAVPVASMLRLSGSALLLAGVLTGVAAALQATAWPPSTSEALPGWVESHHLALALIDECLGIGAALLAVGVVGLWQALHAGRRPAIATGLALVALSTPVSLFLAVIHGRLIYPAYGLDVAGDPQNLALVVTVWAGGAHMVSLTLLVAGLTIGVAMLRDSGKQAALGALGVAAGGTQLLVAYPWLLPVAVVTTCQILLAAWFAALGVSLFLRASSQRREVSHSTGDVA